MNSENRPNCQLINIKIMNSKKLLTYIINAVISQFLKVKTPGSESLEYLTNLLDECYENQLNQLLNQCDQNSSYSPSMLDCMVPKIQEKFDIILSQYLTEKLIGLRLN